MKAALPIILVSFLLTFSACSSQKEQEREVVIGSAELEIPEEIVYWFDRALPDGFGNDYRQVEFNFDIKSFKNIKRYKYEKPENNLHVMLRASNAKHNERKLWTKEDVIYKSKETDCEDIVYDGKKAILCQNESNRNFTRFIDSGYSIKAPDSDQYLSMFGCQDPAKIKVNRNICTGRMQINKNIHVEYIYEVLHASESVKIDEKIRQFVSAMIVQ